MLPDLSEYFVFVIDTDTYAGSFERPMCAFMTGQIGECGVGEEYAEAFRRDHPELLETFQELVDFYPDDHGCSRPATIWPTPGFWNDGMGNEWPDADWGTQKTIDAYSEEIRKYKAQYPKSELEDEGPGRHPAYLSVAIFFSEEPPLKVLEFLCERALKYQPIRQFDGPPKKITGFRLIKPMRADRLVWSADPEGRPQGPHNVV